MATQQGTVDGLLDRLAGVGRAEAGKMFGDHCLYPDGRPVARDALPPPKPPRKRKW